MSKKNTKISHPLYGSSLQHLTRLLSKNWPIEKKYLPKLISLFGSALFRYPIYALEKLLKDHHINNLTFKQPPIFIIGHWRSGTTHIGNILSQSPKLGYVSPIAAGLPWEMLTLGRLLKGNLKKSLPKDRLIDNVAVTIHSPQEDEFGLANMNPFSFLHGLYFPANFQYNFNRGTFLDDVKEKEIKVWERNFIYYLKKVYMDQNEKRLIIRNPVYTGRVELIKKLIPEAKFIFMTRHPVKIFYSMRNYFNKLLPVLSLQPYDHLNVDEIIMTTYSRLMERYLEDSKSLKHTDLVEIKYEELDKSPMENINKIYNKLSLRNFEADKPFFESYLSGIQSYNKNLYQEDQQERKLVVEEWQKYIDYWDY